jgi:hypothetical protein
LLPHRGNGGPSIILHGTLIRNSTASNKVLQPNLRRTHVLLPPLMCGSKTIESHKAESRGYNFLRGAADAADWVRKISEACLERLNVRLSQIHTAHLLLFQNAWYRNKHLPAVAPSGAVGLPNWSTRSRCLQLNARPFAESLQAIHKSIMS